MTCSRFLVCCMAILAAVAGPLRAQPAEPAKVDPAGKMLTAAHAHYSAGRYKMAAEAFAQFGKVFAADKRAAGATFGLGVSRYMLEQYAQAAAEMARVVEVKGFKQHEEALFLLGYCHLQLKDYPKAVAAYERLLTESPGSTRALSASRCRIQALFFGGRTADCAKACQAFIAAYPTSTSRFYVRYICGQSFRKLGKNTEAVAVLAEVVAQGAKHQFGVDAMVLSAQCLGDLRKYPQAAAMYRQMLKIAPPDRQAQGRYLLAVVLYNMGKYTEAAAECKGVLAGDRSPYLAAARYQLGLALWAAGKVPEARAALRAVIKSDPARAADGRYWLAHCDMAEGKYDQARAALLVLAKAAGIKKTDRAEQIAFYVALCSQKAGQFARGAAEFAACRKVHPKGSRTVETLYHQAFCLYQLKQYSQSQALCKQVARAKPCSVTAASAELAGDNLLLLGKYDESEKIFAALAAAAVKAKDSARQLRFSIRVGQCAYLASQHARAVKLLAPLVADKRVAADERYRKVILQLGEAQLILEDYTAAAASIKKFLSVSRTDRGQATFKLGKAQLGAGRKDLAAKAFAAGMAGDPGSAWTVRSTFEYGYLAYRQGQGVKAAAALSKVVANKGVAAEMAGGAMYLLACIDADANKYPRAAAGFAAMIKAHPKHANVPDASYRQARCTMLAGKHEEALALFKAYMKSWPAGANVARAKFSAARCLVVLARHAEAKVIWTVLAADKKTVSDDVLYNLAWAQRETKELDAATATYRRLIKDYPNGAFLAESRTELGGILFDRAQYKPAAELLEAVVADKSAADRLCQVAGYQLGCCYQKLGDDVKTAAAMEAFAAKYPKGEHTASALYVAGSARTDLKKYPEAIKHFTMLIVRFGDSDMVRNAYIKLGQAQNQIGAFDQAAVSFGAFLKRFEKDQWAYLARFGMGWSFEGRKKYAEARKWYTLVESTHNGPTAARAKLQIGQTYFAERNYKRAAAELLSVHAVYDHPQWAATALLEAGRAFEAAKDPDSAKIQYALCIKEYPKSDAAKVAATNLKALGG